METLLKVTTSLWDGLNLTMAVSGFAAVIKLMKTYYVEKSENERLQQQKTSHELRLLKSQINSGFLLNTLKCIRQHIRNHSMASSGLILKFSNLLSYALYENTESSVALHKEIEIIKEYLELEREGNCNKIEIEITQHGEVGKNRIVPLVLLPLVESCFEHSSNNQKKDARILLQLRVTQWVLLLTIDIENMHGFNEKMFEESLRIKNVKQRLNFYYSGKHQLEIMENENNYTVQLEMGI